jgi:uncharacterized membrane protein YiaA
MSRQQFDTILNKLISRKLLVFAIACIGLFNQTLTSSDWVVIATAYIGIEGFTNIVTQLKK